MKHNKEISLLKKNIKRFLNKGFYEYNGKLK